MGTSLNNFFDYIEFEIIMSSSSKRTVLVTGCSKGGAGNSLALEFAAQGCRVFATARSLKSLENLAAAGIEVFTLDVTSPESIDSLKKKIFSLTNGKLDILYNNAGVMYEAPAIEADPVRVRQMFETNVFGLFNVVAAFAPLLIAAGPGSTRAPLIVNVASILAKIPMPFASAYNATKAAVASYSDTLRLELEPMGVDVATLFMGEVSTSLMLSDNIHFGEGSLYIDVEHKVKERSTSHARESTTPGTFARQVVSQVLMTKPASHIWKGSNAFFVWLLNAVGPQKVFDSAMKKGVGLDDSVLVKKIHTRSQGAASGV